MTSIEVTSHKINGNDKSGTVLSPFFPVEVCLASISNFVNRQKQILLASRLGPVLTKV